MYAGRKIEKEWKQQDSKSKLHIYLVSLINVRGAATEALTCNISRAKKQLTPSKCLQLSAYQQPILYYGLAKVVVINI